MLLYFGGLTIELVKSYSRGEIPRVALPVKEKSYSPQSGVVGRVCAFLKAIDVCSGFVYCICMV